MTIEGRTNKIQIAVNAEYFDSIKSGEKLEEYRLYNDYWKKRLIGREYGVLILTKGYPKKTDYSRKMAFAWKGYVIKVIRHPHFGPDPVKVFAISAAVSDRVSVVGL